MSLCLTLYVAREMSLCSTLYVAREMSLSLTLYEVAKTVSVSLEVQISVCLSVCLSVLLQQSSTNVVVVGGQQPGQTVIIEKSVGHLPLLLPLRVATVVLITVLCVVCVPPGCEPFLRC